MRLDRWGNRHDVPMVFGSYYPEPVTDRAPLARRTEDGGHVYLVLWPDGARRHIKRRWLARCAECGDAIAGPMLFGYGPPRSPRVFCSGRHRSEYRRKRGL